MADSRTIQIKLKAISDFSDVVNNAKEIQTVLSRLKLPDNLKSNFTKIFEDIERYSGKASESMAKGFKTKGDVANFERSIDAINTSMGKLVQNVGKLDADAFGFGSQAGEIAKVNTEIAQLEKQFKDLTQLTKEQNTALQNFKAPSGAKAWGEFLEALKTEDIDQMEKSLGKLSAQLESGRVKNNLAEYTNGVNLFRGVLTQLKGTSEEAINTKNKLDDAYSRKSGLEAESAKEGQANIEGLTKATEELGEKTRASSNDFKESAENLQRVSSELDHFKSRIAYFFGAANAVNLFKRAIRSAFATVQDLDKVMTETAVVTEFSVGDMWSQLPEYTRRANELGVSIHAAYEAATIYYQQGLKTNQVMAVSNETLKMARIAGLDAAEATDRMTNALRGFNMEINETNAQRIADVYSKLAAISASNVDEISTAMTKVASLASNANMQFETTAAFLSQIIETTRESAETAGTALKTVVARFSEVKKLYSEGQLLGTDEEGEEIDVNRVSTALRSAGINLNEYLAGMKGLDDIFLELASKWDGLDQVQQRYIATMAAGSRQQSRFIAMMQDYGRTQELVNAAQTAGGASQQQYQKTLDSLESKLNKLHNAWNEFLMGIANSSAIKFVVDALTSFINAINGVTKSLPGMLKSVANIGIVFGGMKLGKGIFNRILGDVGGTFLGKGKEASRSFMEGFTSNLTKLKKPFSKDFWLEFTKLPKIDTSPLMKASEDIKNAQKNYKEIASIAEVDIDYVNTLKEDVTAYEKDYASVLKETSTQLGLNAEQTTVLGNAVRYGVDADVAAAAAKGGLTNATINEAYQSAISAGMTEEEARAQTKEMIATYGATAAQEANNTTTKMGVLVKAAYIAQLLFGTAKTREQAAAALSAAGAQWALNSAFAACPIGWIIAGIAALTLAFVALADVISFHDADAQMEHLGELTDKAQERAQQAKERYDDLSSSVESLKESSTALDTLIVGTTEWKEKLIEVNEQVLNLIQKFPDLAQYLEFGKHGEINISAEGTDAVLERQRSAVSNQQSMVSGLQSERFEVETEYLNNQLIAAGEKVESLDVFKEATEDSADELLDFAEKTRLAKLAEKDLNEAQAEYNTLLAQRNAAEEKATQMQQSAIMQQMDEEVLGTDLGQALARVAAKEAQNIEDDIGYIEKKTLDMVDKGMDPTGLRDQLEKQYAEIANLNLKNAEDREAIEAMSSEELLLSFRELKSAVDGATKAEERYNEMRNISEGEQDIAFALMNPEEMMNISEEQAENIEEQGRKILDSIGFKPNEIDDMMKTFKEAKDEAKQQVTENLEKLSNLAPGLINFEGLSIQSQKDISGTMVAAQERVGTEGVTGLANIINSLRTKLDPEQYDKVVGAIGKLDITKADSIDQLSENLEIMGLSADDLGIDIDHVEQEIIKTTAAAREFSLENVRDQIKDNLDLIDELRGRESLGFSPEEMANLVSKGISQEDFQWTGQEWTYMGGTIENLISVLQENTIALQSNKEILDRQIESGEFFQGLAETFTGASREQLMSGDLTGAEFKNFLLRSGTTEITDEEGNVRKVEELNDKLAETLYNRYLELYNNLEANKAQRDSESTKGGQALAEASDLGFNQNEIMAYAQELQKAKDIGQDAALVIATANKKLNTGLGEIIDSYDEWTGLIDESTGLIKRGNSEDAAAFNKLKKSVSTMLNTAEELPDAFFDNVEHMDLLKAAAEGDVEAIDKLREAVTEDMLSGFKEELEGATQIGDMVGAEVLEATTAIDDFSNYLNNNPLPHLDAGEVLDDQDFIDKFNNMATAANWDATQIANAAKNMGFDAEVEYVHETRRFPKVTMKTVPEYGNYGDIIGSHEEAFVEYEEVTGDFPIVKTLTSLGTGGGNVSYGNRSSGGKNKSSSSGGGGGNSKGSSEKEEKPDFWKNPYDELYNLSEKINESIRIRAQLERNYEKMVRNSATSVKSLIKNDLDEIAALEREKDLLQQMQAGRASQIRRAGSKIYTDSEGNRKTFKEMGVTKYASYDFNTGTIQIDWTGLEKIAADASRTEEGEAAEAYISYLEEIVGQYEEQRDAIWEIEDNLEEIRERGKEEYLELEQRIFDALVERDQKVIDDYAAMADQIAESNNSIVSSLQESIQLERQIRDNTEKEEDIADKEARLAYLQRDTSGGNALESMKLQKEIDDARQNYSDTLIDQGIQRLQKDNELAAEQRTQQIDIMQHQLDMAVENGAYWRDVYEYISASFTKDGRFNPNSELTELLKESEAFKGMSELGKMDWIDTLAKGWIQAQEGLVNLKMEQATKAKKMTLGNGTQLTYDSKTGKWKDAKGNTYKNVTYNAQTGQYTGTSNNDAPKATTTTTTTKPATSTTTTSKPAASTTPTIKVGGNVKTSGSTLIYGSKNGKGVTQYFKDNPKYTVLQIDGNWVQVRHISAKSGVSGWFKKSDLTAYATGGMVDMTGPAWLDGTKSKPEAVLSAEDTKNFVALRDVLSQFMSLQGAQGTGAKGGDNYYDIDIQADISNDYDVDKLSARIKKQILDDSMYRNVNAISFIR